MKMTEVTFTRPAKTHLSERAYDLVVRALVAYRAALKADLAAAVKAGDGDREIDIRMDREDLATLIERFGG